MKPKQSYNFRFWVTRLSLAAILLPVFYFVIQAIAEDEIQSWWRDTARLFIFEPLQITIKTSPLRWQLIIFALLIVAVFIAIVYTAFSLGYRRRTSSTRNLQQKAIPQVFLERQPITNMHVINAVSAYRRKELDMIDLATLVMYAVNSNAIPWQVGNEALNNTPFHLKSIDGKFVFALKDPDRR